MKKEQTAQRKCTKKERTKHKTNQENKWTYRLLAVLGTVILFTFLSSMNFYAAFTGKVIEIKQELEPAEIEITKISLSNCDDCFNISSIISNIKQQNVKIKNEKTLDFSLQEAKNLIERYGIKKLPAIIVTGEVNKSAVYGFFNSIGEIRDSAFILTSQEPPFYDIQEKRVIGRVEIIKLIDNSCLNCFDMETVVSLFKRAGVTISDEKNVMYDSVEGRNLIQKYGIKEIPALIVSKDITQYNSLQQIWSRLNAAEKNGFYVLHALRPPFRDLLQNKIVGLVDLVMLEDKACLQCYNVSINKQILARFGIFPITEETYDINSTKGKELISKYNIEKVPIILLSPEAKVYNSFAQVWKQVGDVEDDGWFVMRNPELLGVVKNLTTGELIDLRSQPQQTQQQPQQESKQEVREIKIDLSNYKFEPSSITVKKGEKIKLILTSKDIYHTFTVDELGINIEVFPGQTVTKEIVPNKSGTFKLYCVPHESLGMVGEFSVE